MTLSKMARAASIVLIATPAALSCSKGKLVEPPAAAASASTATASSNPVAPAADAPAPALTTTGFQRSYDEEAIGRLDAALTALDDAPSTPSASYVSALRRGWLLFRLGRFMESIAEYKRATNMAPASVEARVGELAPLAALRRWVDVESTARDVLKTDPGNYQATIRLAYAQYSLAKFAEAAKTYRALLDAYPSDVDVQGGLGWSLLKLGKKTEATAAFERVIESAPKNALALDGLRAATERPVSAMDKHGK